MTNEIKEILDYFRKFATIRENTMISEIEDYITNLQNEIFDLKDTIQNKNDCIGAYECIIEDRDKRIDKAVDKIILWGEILDKDFQKELLDILRGDE